MPPCQLFVWNGDAGSPSLFDRFGLAMLRQPKRTCVGFSTSFALTTTFSPYRLDTYRLFSSDEPAIKTRGLLARSNRQPRFEL